MIYDDVQYTKNDWRNRNQIMTPRGKAWITVPVKHVTGQRICDVQTSDPSWQRKHWDKLRQNYKSSPYFKNYQGYFEDFYLGKPVENLSTANLRLIQIVNELLGINTNIIDSREFSQDFGTSERLVHILQELRADTYVSGPAAQAYLDVSLFHEAGIEIEFINYENYPEYSQQSYAFSHDVSILDLLFNCGPDSSRMMKSFG